MKRPSGLSSPAQAEFPRPWSPGLVPLAVATGVLMVLSFPLYGDRYQLDHLVWVTLVPLFLAARGVGAQRGFFLGWCAGMTLECSGFVWILAAIRRFTDLGPLFSSFLFLGWLLYGCVPWGLLGWALGRCRKSAQVLWVIPFWVGVEHYFPRLFPWHVGGALYARPWLLQSVDLVGASGLTALVFLVSGGVYLSVVSFRYGRRFPWKTVSAVAMLLTATLAYGAWRLHALRQLEGDRPRLRVGFVQGNLDPRDRNGADGGKALDDYLAHSEKLVEEDGPLDLVVWPEGANPYRFFLIPGSWWKPLEMARGVGLRQRLEDLPAPLVAGGSAFEPRRDDKSYDTYNVAFYLQKGKDVRFYKKNHRLLFGEYVPFLDLLPDDLRKRLAFVGTIAAGSDNPLFSLGSNHFRNVICYEAVLPDYVRASAQGADFLVNVTEDIWYGNTAHVPQHLSVLILRSVESRVPVVRSTNVGPSGIVGVTGEFRGTSKVFQADTFVEEFAPGRVTTLYDRGGHLFPLFCLILGVALQWRLRRS